VKKKSVKKAKKLKKQKAKEKAIPDKSNLAPVVGKGLDVINSYAKTDAKLTSQVSKLQAQVDAMKQSQVKAKASMKRKIAKAKAKVKMALIPNKYHHIPYFKFTAAAKHTKGVRTQKKCQEICDRQPKCMSYSWSKAKHDCLWSVTSVLFDPNFNFYAKQKIGTAGSQEKAWRVFAGMKWTQNLKEKTGLSADQCRAKCAENTGCSSYSYKAKSKFCSWGSGELEYSPDYQFYMKEDNSKTKKERALKAARKHVRLVVKKMRERTKKKEQRESARLSQENQDKKKKKEIWVKQLPTRSQKRKMKEKVQLQVDALRVSLAAKRAKGKKAAEKVEKTNIKRKNLGLMAKVRKMELSLRKAKAAKVKAQKAANPIRMKEVSSKARVEKLKTSIKLMDIDLSEERKTEMRALATYNKAQKKKDEKVMAQTKAVYNAERRKVAGIVKKSEERGKKRKALIRLAAVENAHSQTAEAKVASANAYMKAKEAGLKAQLGNEKAKMRKEKLGLENAATKAMRSKLTTASAKERLSKVVLAHAKVAHWKANMELKHVRSDEERRKAQLRWSATAADQFHAIRKERDLLNFMKRTAFKLANTKELLHKAQHKAKRSGSTKIKRKLALKVAELKAPKE